MDSEGSVMSAYEEGRFAAACGLDIESNPYDLTSIRGIAWNIGWIDFVLDVCDT